MVKTLISNTLERRAKGQVIIILALVFVAMIVAVGLVVDSGTVLARYAQMRRTADAAAVQASNQFREFRPLYNGGSGGDMFSAAAQVAAAQGFIPPTGYIRLYACTGTGFTIQSSPALPGQTIDPPELEAQLCTTPPRKLVRIDLQTEVGLPFLSVVGWRNVTLRTSSVTEAASLDLVIVLDRSSSMSIDTGPAYLCSPTLSCYPFEDVRENAKNLVNKLYFPYDHVALVEFSRRAKVFVPSVGNFITPTDYVNTVYMISDKSQAWNALNDNTIFNIDTCDHRTNCYDNDMPGLGVGQSGATVNTNTGGAIRVATTILAVQGRLRGSVWMMLLLSDGTPNATDPVAPFTGGFCPPSTWNYGQTYTVAGYTPNYTSTFPYGYPNCQRVNVSPGGPPTGFVDKSYDRLGRACLYTTPTPPAPSVKCAPGTTITDSLGTQYDATDYMRDAADYMASNGIVAFVIGLGSQVAEADNNFSTQGNCTYGSGDPRCSRERNAGERLLRYVADVGTQPNTWQCHSDYWTAGETEIDNTGKPDHHCGNYWYAATGGGLQAIFEAIANRIFTRITQ